MAASQNCSLGQLNEERNEKISVLLVEHDPAMASRLLEAVHPISAAVRTARRGDDALTLLEMDRETHIVISGYSLPDMEGLDLLRRIERRFPRMQRMLTASPKQLTSIAREIEHEGALWYIPLPLQETALRLLLGRAHELHRAIQEITRLLDRLEAKNDRIEEKSWENTRRLAGDVAHEINNPVAGILAFAQMMKTDPDRSRQDLEQLGFIEASAKRCIAVVESLVSLSRPPGDKQR